MSGEFIEFGRMVTTDLLQCIEYVTGLESWLAETDIRSFRENIPA